MAEADIFAVDVKHGRVNITDFRNYKRCQVAVDVISDTWKCLNQGLGNKTAIALRHLGLPE